MTGRHRHDVEPDAASDLLERWQAHVSGRSAHPDQRPAPRHAAPVPAVTAPAPPRVGVSTDVEFRPRRGVRALVGLLVLILLVATVLAGVVAYDDRTALGVGATVVLAVATLAVWAVRAGSSPARLAIRSGQLEVVRGHRRDVVDLRSQFTRVETVGRPGHQGWSVLFERVGQDPLVVDGSMVDAVAFTEALQAHRPATTR